MADWDDWGGSAPAPVAPTTTTTNSSSSGSGDSGWGSSSGGDPWTSGGGSSQGNRSSFGGRRESNGPNNYNRSNGGSSWASKSGWGRATASVSASGRHKINTPSMITIDKMSIDTSVSDIRVLFGRYGKIARIVLDYQYDEDKLFCWLDYETQESVDVSVTCLSK